MNTTTNTRGVSEAMVERAITAAMRQCRAEGVAMSDKRWDSQFPSAAAWRAALEAALSAEPAAQAAGWMTTDEEGSPSMLFFDRDEAIHYCDEDEQPIPLYTALPAQPAEAVIDFAGKGEAGPFQIVGGKITLPQVTLDDLRDRIADTAQPAERVGLAGAMHDMRDAVGGCCDQLQERIKQLEAQPAQRVKLSQETPLPWSYRRLDRHFAIEASNGVRVAEVRFVARPDGTTSEAQAKVIVDAVNAAPSPARGDGGERRTNYVSGSVDDAGTFHPTTQDTRP